MNFFTLLLTGSISLRLASADSILDGFKGITTFNVSSNSIKVRTLSTKCEEIDNVMINYTDCYLKPTRDGTGKLFIRVKPNFEWNDMWIQLQVLYKYGHVWRPWMINFDYDWCGITAGRVTPHVLFSTLIHFLRVAAPSIIRKCPYLNEVAVLGINMAEIVQKSFPQVIPKGEYKGLLRFYRNEASINKTFISIHLVFKIDASEVMKSFNMG